MLPATMNDKHDVDKGAPFDALDQFVCPPDAYLWRVTTAQRSGTLLVRSGVIIEASSQLKHCVGMEWSNILVDVARCKGRLEILKEPKHTYHAMPQILLAPPGLSADPSHPCPCGCGMRTDRCATARRRLALTN